MRPREKERALEILPESSLSRLSYRRYCRGGRFDAKSTERGYRGRQIYCGDHFIASETTRRPRLSVIEDGTMGKLFE